MWFLRTDSIPTKGHFTISANHTVPSCYLYSKPVKLIISLWCDAPSHTVPLSPIKNVFVLEVPVRSFCITSHSNPVCPVSPISSWPVPYRLVPNYPVLIHSVFSCCDPSHSFTTWSDLLHIKTFILKIVLFLYIPIWFLAPITFHIISSHCNTFQSNTTQSDSSSTITFQIKNFAFLFIQFLSIPIGFVESHTIP